MRTKDPELHVSLNVESPFKVIMHLSYFSVSCSLSYGDAAFRDTDIIVSLNASCSKVSLFMLTFKSTTFVWLTVTQFHFHFEGRWWCSDLLWDWSVGRPGNICIWKPPVNKSKMLIHIELEPSSSSSSFSSSSTLSSLFSSSSSSSSTFSSSYFHRLHLLHLSII